MSSHRSDPQEPAPNRDSTEITFRDLSLFAIAVAVVGLACMLWIFQPVSAQELLANYAKARDFLSGVESVRGLPWWSPMYLMGTSLAFSWSFMLTNIVMLAFSLPLGFLAGPKVALMACVFLGAAGMFVFLRRDSGDTLTGAIGAALFLLCPSLLTRAAEYEHFVVVCSMALLPWTFWGIALWVRNPSTRSAVGVAMLTSAVFLAYGKTGLMAMPFLACFFLSEFFKTPRAHRPDRKNLLIALAAFLLLTVVPNLPALRETRFVAMFEFGPFEGWQRAFSTKSALGWIDRGGYLTENIAGAYAPTTGNGGTYMGLLVFGIVTAALFRGSIHSSAGGRRARLFLVFALLAFWLSFGPSGVLGGHFFFLSLSKNAPDFAPALGWLFLAAQVWVIFRLLPPNWPARPFLGTALAAIYLLVPAFRVLEWLPLYRNIRAPFDFYQITGTVCLLFAAAFLVREQARALKPGVLRSGLITAVLALSLLDASPYARRFFQPALSHDVFQDFLQAQEHIKSSPIPGRVQAFSGRYFYLLTPQLSGRALVNEAFNSYLQQRNAALLVGAAFQSDENLRTFFNVAGVSHVLIDKTDEDTSKELQQRLRKLLPVGFENDHFAVLENKNSPGRAFLAREYIQASGPAESVVSSALGAARNHLAAIDQMAVDPTDPALQGRIVDGLIEGWDDKKAPREGEPFLPVSPAGGATYGSVSFQPAPASGWLVFNEAWHPDWKAGSESSELPIRPAFGGLQGVHVQKGQAVEFRFQAPWWYPVCIIVAVLSWAAALCCLIFFRRGRAVR